MPSVSLVKVPTNIIETVFSDLCEVSVLIDGINLLWCCDVSVIILFPGGTIKLSLNIRLVTHPHDKEQNIQRENIIMLMF